MYTTFRHLLLVTTQISVEPCRRPERTAEKGVGDPTERGPSGFRRTGAANPRRNSGSASTVPIGIGTLYTSRYGQRLSLSCRPSGRTAMCSVPDRNVRLRHREPSSFDRRETPGREHDRRGKASSPCARTPWHCAGRRERSSLVACLSGTDRWSASATSHRTYAPVHASLPSRLRNYCGC